MPSIKTLSGKSYYEIIDPEFLFFVNPILPDGTLCRQIYVVFKNVNPDLGLQLPDLANLGGQFNFELIIVNKAEVDLRIFTPDQLVNGIPQENFIVGKLSSVTLNGNSENSYTMFGGFNF